jgi:hypothetical protein
MNANELIEFQEDNASEARANGFSDVRFMQTAAMLRQQQSEIEKLRSWVEMLVEVPFFNEIDHYRGIPVAILRKASEK